MAEHRTLAGTKHAVAQMNQVHTAQAPLSRTRQTVQRPLAGPAQGTQQALDKLPFSFWKNIWVPGLAEHQSPPPMEQVQKWTGSQLPSPWKLVQGPTGHQLLPPEEQVWVRERAMSNPLGELDQGPSHRWKNSTSFQSTTVFVFMNLLMQVGEQKQSFDSPAHIHSKQSSKRIIQGSKL